MGTGLCMATIAASAAALCSPAAADFEYPDFTSSDSLILVGSAASPGADLVLTPFLNWHAGAAWHGFKQLVGNGFVTTFEFSISTIGADGMAFVLQNDHQSALGLCGGSLGFSGGISSGCTFGQNVDIQNALVVELDTWNNGEYGDPDDNHVGIFRS